jgi:hypothetical protein
MSMANGVKQSAGYLIVFVGLGFVILYNLVNRPNVTTAEAQSHSAIVSQPAAEEQAHLNETAANFVVASNAIKNYDFALTELRRLDFPQGRRGVSAILLGVSSGGRDLSTTA